MNTIDLRFVRIMVGQRADEMKSNDTWRKQIDIISFFSETGRAAELMLHFL